MQLRSLDGTGSQVSFVLCSPNSKAKLLLLERRLTGSRGEASYSEAQAPGAAGATPVPNAAVPLSHMASNALPAGQAAVLQQQRQQQSNHTPKEVIVIDPSQDPPAAVQQLGAPTLTEKRSPTVSGSDLAAHSASKRRKTGKPQHRPSSLEAAYESKSTSAAAVQSGVKDTLQRDKPLRPRNSPSADVKQEPGSSNPPMSPVMGGHGHQPANRTPRSHSKQQQPGSHTKGQTNINKFFPLLMDSSSRDSDTPSFILQQQHHQQQQRHTPCHQQQSGQLHLQASPIEGLIEQQAAPGAVNALQRASSSTRGKGSPCRSSPLQNPIEVQQQVAALAQKHRQELEQLQNEAWQHQSQLVEQLSSSQRQTEALQGVLQQLQQDLTHARSSSEERESIVRTAVSGLVVQLAMAEGSLARLQLGLSISRLGNLGVSRAGALGFTEVWEDGPVMREAAARQAVLHKAREEVEAARKALKRRLPPPPKANTPATDGNIVASEDSAGSQYISSAEYVMQDEILKVRLSVLKREEDLLSREDDRLQHEKLKHIRCLKRLRDEDGSRFSGQPTLNRRYVLLQLLGRGGFSEVHKAYDLVALKFVAVKIHQLNSGWSEGRKASYVRHAVREYTIHKALRHNNIVSLTDIFEVDNTTFATVLELCEGGDLEGHLQQHHILPEREARALIAQVFAGLAYLNRAPNSSSSSNSDGAAAGHNIEGLGPRVIHYDLKPANILFDSLGTVKITDFGLSKVVEDGQTMGMELTSQGAGTYWYLPPECFQTGSSSNSSLMAAAAAGSREGAAAGVRGLLPQGLLKNCAGVCAAATSPPRISNKVDVWSAGVILYQMLYGKRPFGEGLSQEQIYRDGVMLNARQVHFPVKPSLSAEGKAFLSRCLAYTQEDRWDVLTAAADTYLQLKR